MVRSGGLRLGLFVLWVGGAAACAASNESGADGGSCASCGGDAADGGAGARDGHAGDAGGVDAANADASGDASIGDATDGNASDAGAADTSADSSIHDAGAADAAADGAPDVRDSGTVGVITGGPCISSAAGATAYRVRWADAGGQAQVVYEVDGLPDRSRNHAAAYGYQIGFTSQFVDPYLAQGGLLLDGSDFVDLEISTVGVASITSATLSIYGRSFDTTTSGSFNWQTFVGTGSTPIDFVSNVAPYRWYPADFTTEITPGDGMVLVRIKAGGSSGSLVVNRIEICMQAN